MKCIKCNSVVADGMQFCPYCGNPILQKCDKCGAELEEGAAFCSNCGNRIGKAQQPNQGQYQQPNQGQYQQPYQSYYQQKSQLPHYPQLTFTEAINLASHRLTENTGRSRRSEFWWWYLFVGLGAVAFSFIPFIGKLVYIAQFLLLFSIILRRFNDCSAPREFAITYIIIYGLGCVFNTLCAFAEPGSDLYYSLIDILGDSFQTYGIIFLVISLIGLFYLVKDSNPEVDPIHGPSPKYTM